MVPPKRKQRGLTTREQNILDFIRKKIQEDGFPPTVREICGAVGLRSTSGVHGYLTRLADMGLINKNPARSRAIEVVDDSSWRQQKMIPMPMVGSVHAGEPVMSYAYEEDVYPLPASLIGKDTDCFMLVVKGDSMINVGIEEGDYLIVAAQDIARNGDIVVALVNDEETTVKRFFRESDHIRLQPENDDYEPIISRNVRIQGKVIGLYRHY